MNTKTKVAMLCIFSLLCGVLLQVSIGWAQAERTVGLIARDVRAYEGYNLYKTLGGTEVHLINNAGNSVHKWTLPTNIPLRPGGEVFLRKNGELVVTSDRGIFALNPDSSLAWEINSEILGPTGRWYGHHEALELPNGNMLVPGFIEMPRLEAEAAGFDVTAADACTNAPDLTVLRVDNLWELAPTDQACGFACGWEVVWRWDLRDHIVQNKYPDKQNYVQNLFDYPNKADISYIDPANGICGQYIQNAWTFGRFNAVGYHPDRDEIVMSASLHNEIWIINHNVTTEEAKGHKGGLLYRWGNPYAYGAGDPFVNATDRGDQKISFQHRVQWVPKGYPGENHILIFDNGTDWQDSSVVEIVPPIGPDGAYLQTLPYGPEAPIWQYDESETPGSFYAALISSAQRLPNGNTLINNGPAGYFFEVTCSGEKVWEYINPATGNPATDAAQGGAPFGVYRVWRYAPNSQGLSYFNLTPGDPLEKYPYTFAIDIIPGSCENRLYRSNTGKIAVAVLGTPNVNVNLIDPNSILFEGFSPINWYIKDVVSYKKCNTRDGIRDLVLEFDAAEIKAALSNASVGDKAMMRLTGYATNRWFLGKGEVTIMK